MARQVRVAVQTIFPPRPGAGAMLPVVSADWCVELPVLVGTRVSLRELAITDAPALVANLNALEVQRFIAPPPSTIEDLRELHRLGAVRTRAWALRLLRGRAARDVRPDRRVPASSDRGRFTTAEWGFALGSSFWGGGYFSDAARMVVDFAFDTVGVSRLEARSAVDNRRGNGALRKLGAVQEGVLRRAFHKGDRAMDAALWTILCDDWRQLRALWRCTIVH